MGTVFCVGGVAIATYAYPDNVVRMNNSSEGYLIPGIGGVARNVAYHLAKYPDTTVQLLSCVSKQGHNTELILSDCENNHIKTDYMHYSDQKCAEFVSVFDEDFDLVIAINSMKILQELTSSILATKLDAMNQSDLVLLDSNLSYEALDYLLHNLSVPTYYETVSVSKARMIGENISLCHTIKANRFEATQLSGCSCDTERGAYRAIDWFLKKGVKQVFITMGSDGIMYADENSCGIVEGEKIDVKDSSNAGDCLSAAVIHSIILGNDTVTCAKNGNHAAALFCQSKADSLLD